MNNGEFQYVLVADCETTGLCYGDNPVFDEKTGEHHQAVSWGLIVADSSTLKPVEHLYVEIAWNAISLAQYQRDPLFGKAAEKIHGLTFEYLDAHGVDEQQAVVDIGNLIVKYWGPENCIHLLGHNVHLFDLQFLKDMFARYDIRLKFGNRHYDTNSIGWIAYETYNSDQLFSLLGCQREQTHNALNDAYCALDVARKTRMIFRQMMGE